MTTTNRTTKNDAKMVMPAEPCANNVEMPNKSIGSKKKALRMEEDEEKQHKVRETFE